MTDIENYIEENRAKFIELSTKVWEYAETRYQEFKSMDLLSKAFEKEGFKVQHKIADIPTAFMAEYGTGAPVIALLGEYDALAGLSQEAIPTKKARIEDGNGQGCGHNLLGVGSLAATFAIKQLIESGKLKGTIRFYGCPAEEGGAGKTFMVQRGVFNDVDAAITWHPGSMNSVFTFNMLARAMAIFRFKGVAAHAAGNPHSGRSALDAVELMNVGANYLREHIIQEARLHYVITNGGGISPNVVPAKAESLYYVRAPKTAQVREIYDRLCKVAKGAAMMTETEVEIIFHSGTSNLVLNETLEERMHHHLEKVGRIPFSAEDQAFAKEISKTLTEGDRFINNIGSGASREVRKKLQEMVNGKLLMDEPSPYFRVDKAFPGSTDVGDVSWTVPTAQLFTSCHAMGTAGHSWQIVAQGGMEIGMKGMLHAAKVMALTCHDLLADDKFLEKVKSEFKQKLTDEPYVSPIPDNAPLPFTLENMIMPAE